MKTINVTEEIQKLEELPLPNVIHYVNDLLFKLGPIEPVKPKLQGYTLDSLLKHDAEELEYNEAMKVYEKELSEHNQLAEKFNYYILHRIRKGAGLLNLNISDKQKEKLWDLAYKRGIKEGLIEVSLCLYDLVDLFKEDK